MGHPEVEGRLGWATCRLRIVRCTRSAIFLRTHRAGLQMDLRSEAQQKAAEHRQRSVRMNELAAHVHSEADAASLIDQVAEMFKESLPPSWTTQAVKMRLAHAEFLTATDDSSLIPEERIVRVWNHCVREIGAPDEAILTAVEVHNLRDALYASGVRLWNQDIMQNVWMMPNIVATGTNGKVAHGCRALEAMRLLYSMARFFDNVRGARERVRLGRVVSEELASRPEKREKTECRAVLATAPDTNPIRPAQRQYIQEHGSAAFNRLLASSFAELFPR